MYTWTLYARNTVTTDKLKTLVQFKCLRALCDPGEAVGLLAAQVQYIICTLTPSLFHV